MHVHHQECMSVFSVNLYQYIRYHGFPNPQFYKIEIAQDSKSIQDDPLLLKMRFMNFIVPLREEKKKELNLLSKN